MEKSPQIIFEDQWLIVLNKPSGMVVNRAVSARNQTLQDWLETYLKLPDTGIGQRAGIVHRLDKETSGLILVAKNEKVFFDLQKQFEKRETTKRYWGLAHGVPKPVKGDIKAPISRNPYRRRQFGVFWDGRQAETFYETLYQLKKGKDQTFSFLKLTPKTGRTHQLRIHLKHIGNPLVSDPLYGGRKNYRLDIIWCPRLFLHAYYLAFVHPEHKKLLEFSSFLPDDLDKALSTLEKIFISS